MDIVSVIIPTFNRFKFLLNAIESIKSQTYWPGIELIVINDCSSEKEYYEYDWKKNNINIIHLEKNSRELFGFACVGYVRNIGIENSSGKYIAFCDDDDIWFPSKIETQLNAMIRTGCKMSSSDSLFGFGMYDNTKLYQKYNEKAHIDILKNYYKHTNFLDNGFPEIWNKEFITIHNCIICSSVVIEKELLTNINNMKCISISSIIPEDYDCWLRALEHTDSVYLKDALVYYDGGHGYGQQR